MTRSIDCRNPSVADVSRLPRVHIFAPRTGDDQQIAAAGENAAEARLSAVSGAPRRREVCRCAHAGIRHRGMSMQVSEIPHSVSAMTLLHRLVTAIAVLLVATSVHAQAEVTLGVSEGTSGGLDHARVIAKYGGLADAIGHAIKRKVQVVFAREFTALDEGIRSGRFDLVLARPSDYPARAMRDHGYQFVASARPDGQCLIITRKDSPLQTLAQAKGARWVLPEKVSYMSKFCTAELRDQGIAVSAEKVEYLREQGAVPFYLDNKFADVGAIASYSGPAKSLEKSGHRVLHKSGAQPYFPLVASKRISSDQVRAIQAELVALSQSDTGREVLKTVGVQSFDTSSGERLSALLVWLGN